MGFWTLLLIVNFCFFLPYYFLNFKSQPNPFQFITDSKISLWNRIRFPYSKISSDPFRINFEFTLAILCFAWIGTHSFSAVIVCTIIGLLTWLLILYAGVMKYIFHRSPVFRSDWQLIKFGLQMTHSQRYLLFPAVVLTFFLLVSLCYWFSESMLSHDVDGSIIPIVAVIISALGLVKSSRVRYEKFFHRTVMSSVMYAYRNWSNSGKYDYLLSQDEAYFKALNPIRSIDLKDRPNLTMICIESYGAISYTDEALRKSILPIIQKFEDRLKNKGYHLASSLSTSPQSGGGSWKCYSTLTYGMKIDDDLLYNLLFKNIDGFKSYKSIFHLLKDQGYSNYLLCPMGNYAEGSVDWELINRNFHSDRYLEYDDMNFEGRPLRFFGNTECPPDQYSIHRAAEILREDQSDPYFLFFTSLNSHYPFTSPTKVVEDWKALNDKECEVGLLKKGAHDLKAMYGKAIEYQLEVFLDYIDKSDEPLFVLFGDHQPPFVAGEENGKETPIHVISKSPEFIAEFTDKGFANRLLPKTDISIKHEGFLSILSAALQAGYGDGSRPEVEYQPHGVKLN